VPAAVELSGVTVVGVGSFNPAIFHPIWFVEKQLMTKGAAEEALSDMVVGPQLTAYKADWLTIQVSAERAVFSTVEEGREPDLRDLARSVFEILPETPVDALGINADSHFRVESEEKWHSLGDLFAPKEFWTPMFEGDRWKSRSDGESHVGLRSLTMEAYPADLEGYIRVEVAPSVRVTPDGVYVGINGHFQLTLAPDERRANGFLAAQTLNEHWDDARATEQQVLERILEAT
jgi:hypothetical protein